VRVLQLLAAQWTAARLWGSRSTGRHLAAAICLFDLGLKKSANFWKGDGVLLTLALASLRWARRKSPRACLAPELDLAAALAGRSSLEALLAADLPPGDSGRSFRPADMVVVVVLTLRWPPLGVGLTTRPCLLVCADLDLAFSLTE